METDERAATLAAAIEAIPTLPVIVNRVLDITANPESGAQELMDVIIADPVLTAKILKIANSAFYNRSGQIATLKQSLMVIGFKEVRNLVLATSVLNNFNKLKRVPGFDAHLFWRHSFVTGLACKIMARTLNLPSGELFVAGLIHDIGKLIMAMALPTEFVKMIKMTGNFGLENVTAEKHLLGLTHEETGLRLLRRWAFPRHLLSAAGYHHHPALADTQVPQALAVHLADLLAHIGDHDQAGEPLPEGCFAAETVSLARAHGIDWSPGTVKQQTELLEDMKKEQSSVLDIFLA